MASDLSLHHIFMVELLMELFIVIAMTHFLALLSPGPDFFLLLMTILNSNRANAFLINCGITLGNALILFWLFVLSIFIGNTPIINRIYK
ncbi:hypothetical protein I2F62_10700 [Acinetobacter sp. MD2(2019)]|nr:hypothetical protein [Acinetobacter sp. MD2(2019)]